MVIINARFLTQKITGVQRYAIEISKQLPEFIGKEKVVFVAPKSPLINADELIDKEVIQFGAFKGNLWEQVDLFLFLKKNKKSILINFSGISPVFLKRKIMYLHDLAFKHYPKSFSYAFAKAYNLLIPIAVKNAKNIITVSNYVRKDIQNHLKTKKIDVVYASHSNFFKLLNKKREKIILSVSSIDPRKNINRVIEAFNKIDSDYTLVFVGAESKSFSSVKVSSSKKVIFTGYINDQELLSLYNKASIFIYASLFEGFGIPPLEAQACGCPCIVSNKSSLPEVYGDSVIYCDPYSVDAIKEKLNFLIKNKKERELLAMKGFENVKCYSWDTSAKKLITIIESNFYFD
ncbi:glycosyltransferase family 1 protein [uncultured Tenacibaculum sp.]|uniref:glycosyltransferase family 4 protein n=1 Tax=uncultured Tenacibaculum sp. TaxID=174713 RepID=UPI00260B9C58|nr:glycosyltransferase family 1 protein [uncultured Tenacibaculum sp.]